MKLILEAVGRLWTMKASMRSVDSFSLSEHETGKFVVQLLRCRWTDLKAVWLWLHIYSVCSPNMLYNVEHDLYQPLLVSRCRICEPCCAHLDPVSEKVCCCLYHCSPVSLSIWLHQWNCVSAALRHSNSKHNLLHGIFQIKNSSRWFHCALG